MTGGAESPLRSLPIEFVGSFPDPRIALDPPLPEIAFVGRSNVGKSSLLNALVGRTGMARVSATPGKTSLLNVFRLPELYLIDLPGYGWARTGKTNRAAYRRLVEGYLKLRTGVAGIVWLLDIRHPPSKEDAEMQEMLAASGHPTLVVFTKADKLTRRQQQSRTAELAESLALVPDQVQTTSSSTGLGIAELGESILAAVTGGGSEP